MWERLWTECISGERHVRCDVAMCHVTGKGKFTSVFTLDMSPILIILVPLTQTTAQSIRSLLLYATLVFCLHADNSTGAFKTVYLYSVNVMDACYLAWVVYFIFHLCLDCCQHPFYFRPLLVFWSTPLPELVHIFPLVHFSCRSFSWEFLLNVCNEVSTSCATVTILRCPIDCLDGV
jgi:hypothetical protein